MPPKVSLFLPTDRARRDFSSAPRCQTPKHPAFSPHHAMRASMRSQGGAYSNRLGNAGSRSVSTAGSRSRRSGPSDSSSREIVRKPWESSAVTKFASRVGVDPRAQPMVIKNAGSGPTILGALGESEDHQIAGNVLQRVYGTAKKSSSAKQSDSRAMTTSTPDEVSFGVVYEHRDCFGAPKFVGSTDIVAEKQFKLDYESNANINQVVNHNQGSTEVVWAGYGTGPIGKPEMDEIRKNIEHSRAERLNIQKLSGVKPYSRHGY